MFHYEMFIKMFNTCEESGWVMTIGWPVSQPLVIAGSKGIENSVSISVNNI